MRFVLNAMGLVAWALSAFVLFAGVAVISESEPGTTEYMIANASFDAMLPTIGFGLVFGLGCFFVGAVIKRRS
jgi:ABC-type thiamin/hydroxymethylpyrimidine transport system permease subunit